MASLLWTNKISLCVVDGVEHEASQIHGHEIKVHTFNAVFADAYLLTLKLV